MNEAALKAAQIVETLKRYNEGYRQGTPLVDDDTYDQLVETLRGMDPENPYLNTVEPERFSSKKEIRHPSPMLSTEKAYTREHLARFVARVEKEAAEIGVSEVHFRVTPKLDGLAGRDDGRVFATRGNGLVGYDITGVFEKGVVPVGGRGQGLGEIVISKSYFEAHLAGVFVHPRNMVVGIIAADELNAHAARALADGAVHFVPYAAMTRHWEGDGRALVSGLASITETLFDGLDYPVDGLVAEVTDAAVKRHMAATAHHYRWQIAIKEKGDTAVTTVQDIVWQVGRTGVVTPVIEVEPVFLTGAMIRRVTGHNAGNVLQNRIGRGAEIEIIRSGDVIPKIEAVIKPAGRPELPSRCPACRETLIWSNDFLKCVNRRCRAQMEQAISHWFKTLGNADWFGIKSIQKMVDGGFDGINAIYAMTETDFNKLGFGPVQSRNLARAVADSIKRPVEDWRFLAAFGISYLGKGESRKLLSTFRLERALTLTEDELKALHGFGDITSRAIAEELQDIAPTVINMLDLGFSLIRSAAPETIRSSPVSGKRIVFTGKMMHGTREEMEAEATRMGAAVSSAISKSVDYLVHGENAGASKLSKAAKLNIRVLTEADYRQLLRGEASI